MPTRLSKRQRRLAAKRPHVNKYRHLSKAPDAPPGAPVPQHWRNCRDKVAYLSRHYAQAGAHQQRFEIPGLRPYRCELCRKWHLTSH